jgi:hypothetical protein
MITIHLLCTLNFFPGSLFLKYYIYIRQWYFYIVYDVYYNG